MALSLISLNIERSKHLDRVTRFLSEQQADVVCLMEVCEPDIPILEQAIGAPCFFAPMTTLPPGYDPVRPDVPTVFGLAVFSRLPIQRQEIQYYHRAPNTKRVAENTPESIRETEHGLLIITDVEKERRPYRIATTHFTWTPDGKPGAYQREDVRTLLTLLEREVPLVLCGDLNAPRGGEIFSSIAECFKDNIPTKYATSIDVSLHREGSVHPENLADKMVDGMFSSAEYEVDADLTFGISDHAAITATAHRLS